MAISVGIFDRIFKREEKKEPRATRAMSLSDVDAWAEEESRNIQEELVAEMQPAVDGILESREEACEVVEEIRDYKPPPEIKKRMFKPVITAKPKYVKGMLDGLGHIRPLPADTYEALVDFNAGVARALKIIHKTQLSQGPMIAAFFQEEMPRIGTSLNQIMDLQKSIEGGIKDGEERGERASAAKTAAAELRRAVESQRRMKEEAKSAKKEIDAQEAEREKHEQQLKALQESADYKKLAETEENLANVQERLAAVESRGRGLLGPLLRVLRKYVRVAADKNTKKATESYIKDSQAAFFEGADGAAVIMRILSEAQAMAERGELSLSKKEREKVDSAVSHLDSIKEQHTAIKKEEHRLKDALASSGIKNKEHAITAELKQADDSIERLRTDAGNAKSGAKEMKKEIKRLKEQLGQDISEEKGAEVTIEI